MQVYPLIPSQETMYLLVKYSLHKNIVQVPTSITLEEKVDFELLQKALNIEIERNDCMRLRFAKKNKKITQWFIPKFTYDAPVLTFKTKEEQEKALNKDALKPIKFLKGEVFRVIFFNSYDGGSGIFLNASHLIMDAMAAAIFYIDLINVYSALKNGEDMPKPLYRYEDYIKKELKMLEDKKMFDKGAAFYKEYWLKDGEPFYAGIHGHNVLDKYRKKNPEYRVPPVADPFHDKAALKNMYIPKDTAAKIFEYCLKNQIAPETILQIGYRLHVSSINYREPDTLALQLCSKRITFKDKHMGGCIAQPLQVRCILPEELTFEEGVIKLNNVRTQLYRYLNFPYLAARFIQMQCFNYKATQAPAFMMFTWIPLPVDVEGYPEIKSKLQHLNLPQNNVKFKFDGYNLGHYALPMYGFAYPDRETGGICCRYMHRTATITEEQTEVLHNNMVKIVLAGIENPNITIKELMDSIS
jgi:hypothetical protein